MRHLFFAFLLLLIVLQPLAAEKRAMTVEDLWSLGRLAAPTQSPDGKSIVFVVRTPSIPDNKFKSDIYLIDSAGKSQKNLTSGQGSNSNPVIMGDGRLFFLSTRSGEAQLHGLQLSKPETVTQLTRIKGGIGSFVVSPDGKAIAFQRDVYPQATDLQHSIAMEEVKSKEKTTGKILTGLMFRVWNAWKDDQRSHVFYHVLGSDSCKDLTPGDADCPPLDLGGNQDFVFSADGKSLAFVRNPDPMVAISTNNDVFLLDIASGKVENVSQANKANDAGPVFSPKGNYLAYLSMKRPGYEADKKDIVLFDLKNRSGRNLTGTYPDTITDIAFSPDEKYIYFIGPESIFYPVFQLEIKSGRIVKLIDKIYASALEVAADGKSLLFLAQKTTSPYEVFTFDIKGRKLTQVSNYNQSILGGLALNPAETFSYKGAKGDMVEGILVKPPFFDPARKYPMVFLVHGGPQGGWADDFHFRWNTSLFAAQGYVVVAINFHGSHGYGQTFTDGVTRDWGGAPFVDLVNGQSYCIEKFPFIDSRNLFAAGASYGGFMINWMAGHMESFKYPFQCLISHNGIFDARSMYYATEELWFEEWEYGGMPWNSDLYEKFNPANFVTKMKTPMLVVHSEKDFRVPVSQGLMLFTALQRLGVPSKMLYFPDEDHFVNKPQNARQWWNTMLSWFKQYQR